MWIKYPGLSGGICIDGSTIPMPIKHVTIRDAIYVFKHKDPKILIKSGLKKGQRQKVIKTAAKIKNEYDVSKIYDLLMRERSSDPIIYIEALGTTRGNSAKVTRTTQINYGKLLAIFEILNYRVKIVTAQTWKKKLNLPKDKEVAVAMAEELSGISFRTSKGALKDGEAESYLIWRYGVDNEII